MKIGENEAKVLVEFVEYKIDNKFEENMDQLATKKDLQELKGELEIKMEKVRSDLIKWMFVFWIGQVSVTIALIMLFFK